MNEWGRRRSGTEPRATRLARLPPSPAAAQRELVADTPAAPPRLSRPRSAAQAPAPFLRHPPGARGHPQPAGPGPACGGGGHGLVAPRRAPGGRLLPGVGRPRPQRPPPQGSARGPRRALERGRGGDRGRGQAEGSGRSRPVLPPRPSPPVPRPAPSRSGPPCAASAQESAARLPGLRGRVRPRGRRGPPWAQPHSIPRGTWLCSGPSPPLRGDLARLSRVPRGGAPLGSDRGWGTGCPGKDGVLWSRGQESRPDSPGSPGQGSAGGPRAPSWPRGVGQRRPEARPLLFGGLRPGPTRRRGAGPVRSGGQGAGHGWVPVTEPGTHWREASTLGGEGCSQCWGLCSQDEAQDPRGPPNSRWPKALTSTRHPSGLRAGWWG